MAGAEADETPIVHVEWTDDALAELSLEVMAGPGIVPEEQEVQRLVAATLRAAGVDAAGREVGVRFTSAAEMAELNGRFRGRDESTDVLAFPAGGDPGDPSPPVDDEPGEVGDIAICAGHVAEQVLDGSTMLAKGPGQEQGDEGLREALERCIVHGTLHLAGHDHEAGDEAARAMFELEQRVLDAERGG